MSHLRPTFSELLKDICDAYEMNYDYVLTTDTKEEEVVKCRRVFCYIAYFFLRYKLRNIGMFIGYRDHSSAVYHAHNVFGWINKKDPMFMKDWEKYILHSKLWVRINEYKEAA